jgi:hypothetical protein
MKWLVNKTLAVISLLIACVATSVVISRIQPASPYIRWLHLTECKPPCWIGIIPGQTTVKDASIKVKAVYTTSPENIIEGDWGEFSIMNSQNKFNVFVQFNVGGQELKEDTLVENIWLWTFTPSAERQILIGDLYWILDSPNAVLQTNENTITSDIYYFDALLITVKTSYYQCGRIAPQFPVLILDFESLPPTEQIRTYFRRWIGNTCYDAK